MRQCPSNTQWQLVHDITSLKLVHCILKNKKRYLYPSSSTEKKENFLQTKVSFLPPQFQTCPSSVSTIVKNPPQDTVAIGTGNAFTLQGILSPPPSFGPRPGPRPNRPSPSSRPQV